MMIINEANIPFSAKWIWIMKIFLERRGHTAVGPSKLASMVRGNGKKTISRSRVYEAINHIKKAGLFELYNTPFEPVISIQNQLENGHENGHETVPESGTQPVPESGTTLYRKAVQHPLETVPESGTMGVPESGTVAEGIPYTKNTYKCVYLHTSTTEGELSEAETHTLSSTSGPSLEEVQAYFQQVYFSAGVAHDPRAEAEVFWSHNEGLGWYSGSTPILRWRHFADKWIARIRSGQFQPAQANGGDGAITMRLPSIEDYPQHLQAQARQQFPDIPETRAL